MEENARIGRVRKECTQKMPKLQTNKQTSKQQQQQQKNPKKQKTKKQKTKNEQTKQNKTKVHQKMSKGITLRNREDPRE